MSNDKKGAILRAAKQKFEASKTNLSAYLKDTGTFFLRIFDDKERLGLLSAVLNEPHCLFHSGRIMYQNAVDLYVNSLIKK